MNESIKECMFNAGLNSNYVEGFDSIYSKQLEKFAELIVRECAGVAKQSEPDDGDDYKSGRVWAGIDILKHFNVGVEE